MELLTTLAAVKDELGITDDSKDAYLRRSIAAASGAIARYCDRTFGRKTITETLTGRDTASVFLSLTPIVEIESVEIGGALLDKGAYVVDEHTGELRRVGGVWPWTGRTVHFIETVRVTGSEQPNIAVKYTGGYVLPKDDEDNGNGDDEKVNLPPELEMACIMTAATWVQGQSAPRDIASMRVDQVQVSFGGAGSGGPVRQGRPGLPAIVLDLLQPFRRVI